MTGVKDGWSKMRRFVTPLLRKTVAYNSIPVVNGQSQTLIQKLKKASQDGKFFNCHVYATKLTFDIAHGKRNDALLFFNFTIHIIP